MLKILKSTWSTIKSGKGRVGVDGDGRDNYNDKVEYNGKDDINGNNVDGGEVGNNEIAEKKNH